MVEPVKSADAPECRHRERHDWYQAVDSRGRVRHVGGSGQRPVPAVPRCCRASQHSDEAGVPEGMQPAAHRPAAASHDLGATRQLGIVAGLSVL